MFLGFLQPNMVTTYVSNTGWLASLASMVMTASKATTHICWKTRASPDGFPGDVDSVNGQSDLRGVLADPGGLGLSAARLALALSIL